MSSLTSASELEEGVQLLVRHIDIAGAGIVRMNVGLEAIVSFVFPLSCHYFQDHTTVIQWYERYVDARTPLNIIGEAYSGCR